MILINSAGLELKEGFKNEVNPEMMGNLKGRFNKNEVLVLVATFNSLIYKDSDKSNKSRLINLVQDCIKFDDAMFIDVDEDTLIEKLMSLNDDEVKTIIQMIFECINRNMHMEKKLDELISEIFGI